MVIMASPLFYSDLNRLSTILSSSIGPNGLDVMYCADGHVLTTNYGLELMKLFHSKHPMFSILLEGARSLHRSTGDGVKRFVMIIAAALQEIRKHVETAEVIKCSSGLNRFTQYLIKELPQLQRLAGGRERGQREEDEVVKYARHFFDTCLTPHHQFHVRSKLKQVLTDGLGENPNITTLRHTMDCFESLVVLDAGGPVDHSSSLSGFLFNEKNRIGAVPPSSDAVSAIVIRYGFGSDTASHTSLQVSSASDVRHFTNHWTHRVSDLLQLVDCLNVRLMIVRGNVPLVLSDTLTHRLKGQLCILTNVPDDTLQAMERVTGVIPVNELDELFSLNAKYIIKGVCKVRSLNGTNYINYIMNACGSAVHSSTSVTTFFLCAPTIGIARKLKLAMWNCLLSLWNSLNEDKVISWVHGGGSWEIELIRILRRSREQNLVKGSPDWVCVTSLEAGLLRVVSSLASIKPHQKASFYQAIYGGTDPLMVGPINGSLVSLADQSHYVIEAYNNIQSIMCNACQVLSQLTRIDALHPVARRMQPVLASASNKDESRNEGEEEED